MLKAVPRAGLRSRHTFFQHFPVMRSPVRWALLALLLLSAVASSPGGGKVYLVLGSDTAIWEGMDVAKYHCTYSSALYTDPSRNAYAVMDATFRNSIRDSEGKTLKLTWWMMVGNIFRTATNTDVPLPNTMTISLMNRYHGNAIRQWGDELSLHYHTFVWTDYDGDGAWYWNQARTFGESRVDFDETLAHSLLEENVYPVSFRSGWETMDNEWQHHLEQILPFSMHSHAGAVGRDSTEPIDNVLDWSRAPSTWVPYHPSQDDYQVPGSLRGWNLRALHLANVNSTLLETLFSRADTGTDQVACLWGHLPETDFLDNIRRVDSLIHVVAAKYPQVTFHYCTAVEAMQRWMNAADRTPPIVEITEDPAGEDVSWSIQTDEALFTGAPFVAVKDRYEQVFPVPCVPVGLCRWKTSRSFKRADVAKVGVAAVDSLGNLTTRFLRYLPDDVYVDNLDPEYSEIHGTWTTLIPGSWGTDARVATVGANDSVVVRWKPPLLSGGTYGILMQIPPVTGSATDLLFRVLSGGVVTDTFRLAGPLAASQWVYVGTCSIPSPGTHVLEMTVGGPTQTGKKVAADVLKYTALVRERQLVIGDAAVNFGMVSVRDTVQSRLRLSNVGTGTLQIFGLSSAAQLSWCDTTLPLSLLPMAAVTVPLRFCSTTLGVAKDTFLLSSNDPVHPLVQVPVIADVQPYFVIVDNDDSLHYQETGRWFFSNAQAHGPTSRYSFLSDGPGARARFSATLSEGGEYGIHEILPKTANATLRARYELVINGAKVDSAFINQNDGSGNWVTLFQREIAPRSLVEVSVSDASGALASGLVLRADALRFSLIAQGPVAVREASGDPVTFRLHQNYPNPFNPATVISAEWPVAGEVKLVVYDLLGREVTTLATEFHPAGKFNFVFDAHKLPSGIYLYRLIAGGYSETRRMLLIR
jgi:Secretion system C-terminal sorting domain